MQHKLKPDMASLNPDVSLMDSITILNAKAQCVSVMINVVTLCLAHIMV